MLILFIYLKYRPETPPNTPQRARAAARQNEHDQRNLDSPECKKVGFFETGEWYDTKLLVSGFWLREQVWMQGGN